MGTELKNCCCA